MNLHLNKNDFENLIVLTSKFIHIPEEAIKRDYYIVLMLQKLEKSELNNLCVFKGGTSLSKCYPNSINRFSEDIDITFIPNESLNNKQYNKMLKKIETTMSDGFYIKKIPEERNDRNKSSWIWFNDKEKDLIKVKLEIGSSIRPDPYNKLSLKTYIHEYLESKQLFDDIKKYELEQVLINTLSIERTFLDKIMAVKRHAICGTLSQKVRHIYDVTKLYELDEIHDFLNNKIELKKLIRITKETDSFYIEKRKKVINYNPNEPYAFENWSYLLDKTIKERYESLHEYLLFTDKKQDFNKAINTFNEINKILKNIDE